MCRKYFWTMMLLGLAAFFGCGGAEPEGDEAEELGQDGKADGVSAIKVSVAESLSVAQPVKIKVSNNFLFTTIYLPGCNLTTLQVAEGEGWKDLAPQKTCVWEGKAQSVAPRGGSLEDSLTITLPGTYRVKALFKTGCKASPTYSQCDRKEYFSHSASFQVKGKMCGGIAGLLCPEGQTCKLDGDYPDASGTCEIPSVVSTGKVIEVGAAQDGQTVQAAVGDKVKVRLDGNMTTGYAWKVISYSKSCPVSEPEYLADNPNITGSGGTFVFTITPTSFAAGGKHLTRFAYFRPWEDPATAVETFSFTLDVAAINP